MPVISRFLGILIIMYYKDHNPPHFHAKYGDYSAIIGIDGALLGGYLLSRVLSLVIEWLALHREELYDNWVNACNGNPLKAIPPLV